MKFILGKKVGMSQIFEKNGKAIPVTLIEAGPCRITQVKTKDKDGYTALQIGFDSKKKLRKPEKNHLSKKGIKENFRYLREFKVIDKEIQEKAGNEVTVAIFQEGDVVEITGRSKGKGFQGVVKRHNFKGGPASHGHKHVLRSPGSTGGMFPQHTRKGMKMAGRMGDERVTEKDKKIIKIDPGKNLIAVKGAVPGRFDSLVLIKQVDE